MSKGKQTPTDEVPQEPQEEQPIRVTMKRKTKPLILESESGDETEYVVREMSGSQRDDFLTSNAERVKTDSKGNPIALKSFKGVFSNLIYRCLFEKSNGHQIKQAAVDNWPASQQVDVFRICEEMNGLQDRKSNEEASKND